MAIVYNYCISILYCMVYIVIMLYIVIVYSYSFASIVYSYYIVYIYIHLAYCVWCMQLLYGSCMVCIGCVRSFVRFVLEFVCVWLLFIYSI